MRNLSLQERAMRQINLTHLLCGIVLLFFVQGFTAPQARGSDFLPPRVPETIPDPSTLSHSPVEKITLGSLVIQLEQTTLQQVRDAIGAGMIHHNGKDAGGSEYSLCYTSNTRERIWIASSGELGGPEHDIDSIYAKAGTGLKGSPDCPELPARFQPVLLNDSLWIGSSMSQLRKLFGTPSAKKDGWLFYSYLGKVGAEEFDLSSGVAVRMRNNKVVELLAGQSTTN